MNVTFRLFGGLWAVSAVLFLAQCGAPAEAESPAESSSEAPTRSLTRVGVRTVNPGAFSHEFTVQGNVETDRVANLLAEFPVLADQGNWYPSQIVGLSVNMPIWTSFGGRQRVEKAKLQVLTAQSGLDQLASAARLEFANARATFFDAEAALANAREQRALAQRILERIEAGHREGVRSSFELNTAQNQLLEAEGTLIGAQLAWLTAQQRLIASNPRP